MEVEETTVVMSLVMVIGVVSDTAFSWVGLCVTGGVIRGHREHGWC